MKTSFPQNRTVLYRLQINAIAITTEGAAKFAVRYRKHGSGVTYIPYQDVAVVATPWDGSWLIVHVRNWRRKAI